MGTRSKTKRRRVVMTNYCDPDFTHIRDHVEGILEAMYQTGNIDNLESSIEEVCYELGVLFENREPLMMEKRQNDSVQWHLGYRRGVIDQSHGIRLLK